VVIPNTEQLRTSLKLSAEEKKSLWDQVKNKTFTRTVSGIYASCLLLLFVRVEVNILGRYMYMDKGMSSPEELSTPVSSGDTEEPSGINGDVNSNDAEKPISDETKRNYLGLSEYLLSEGVKQLVEYIQSKVEDELTLWPLTKKCTVEDFDIMFNNMRVTIESDGDLKQRSRHSFHQYLLPPADETPPPAPQQQQQLQPQASTEPDTEQFAYLVNETRDVLESERFATVLKSCLDKSFQVLRDELRSTFAMSAPSAANISTTTSNDFSTPVKVPASAPSGAAGAGAGAAAAGGTLPMAKMIPLVKQAFNTLMDCPLGLKGAEPNGYLTSLFTLKELEDYSYYIFSSSYDEE